MKQNLTKLIQQGESETVEFKKSTAELEAAFRSICAFLNGQGGNVVIGVKNNGVIAGQQIEDSTKKDLAVFVKKIEPQPPIEISYPKISGKKLIHIQVQRGIRQPYTYDGRAYQRNQSTTERMPQHQYEELLSLRNPINHSWEKFLAEKDYLSYIDHDEILRIVRKGVEEKRLPEVALREEIPKLLERLHLTQHGHLMNAAVVLFSKKFMPDYPQCQLKLARFKGDNRIEFLDNNILYGNAFELLEAAMDFVRRNLSVAAKIETGKLERTETPLIPFPAIREALINALCHRDYSNLGGSVGIAIYSDYMEIFNDGGLPPGMSIEQLKSKPRSNPRNPIIADVFYKCALIEKYGSGIERIILTCKAANKPEPEFFSNNTEFRAIFRFTHETRSAIVPTNIRALTERQLTILNYLKHTPLKTNELLKRLERTTSISESTLKRELKTLKAAGMVVSKGQARNTVWIKSNKLQ